MTIKQVTEHDSGFGFFFDRELTQEVQSMNHLLHVAGEGVRYKRVRMFFGCPDWRCSPLCGTRSDPNIIISSSTHPEENQNLGEYILSGTQHAKEMWFTLSKEEATEISITTVRWS